MFLCGWGDETSEQQSRHIHFHSQTEELEEEFPSFPTSVCSIDMQYHMRQGYVWVKGNVGWRRKIGSLCWYTYDAINLEYSNNDGNKKQELTFHPFVNHWQWQEASCYDMRSLLSLLLWWQIHVTSLSWQDLLQYVSSMYFSLFRSQW